jgi:hypothetical protein
VPPERITYRQRLRGRLTAVGPGLADVELAAAGATPLGSCPTLESQLVFRTERSFRQEGTIAFQDGEPALRLTTLGRGDLAEPADGGVRHGTAVLEVCGVGPLRGAHGRITSNFVVGADGEVTDEQVVVLFIDKQGGEGS